uniref:Uncharacterized protein n=1 Tax=Callorhinchus milii TaxID=7868 RepID=A0A4W3J020_CALMI
MGGKEWEERERGRERERERERERGRLKTREVLSAAGVSRAVVFVRDLREGTLGEKLRECGQADPTVLRRGAAGGLAVRITGEGDCLLLTASAAEFCAAAALQPPAIIPLHRLICFCRYFLWLTFLLDLPGLSSASLMLLEAESMKLSRALVVCLPSPGLPAIAAASSSSSPPSPSPSPGAPCTPLCGQCGQWAVRGVGNTGAGPLRTALALDERIIRSRRLSSALLCSSLLSSSLLSPPPDPVKSVFNGCGSPEVLTGGVSVSRQLNQCESKATPRDPVIEAVNSLNQTS